MTEQWTAATRWLLQRPTLEVASALLGWRLIRDDGGGRREARIVEVEAYIGEGDRASHARFGPTARNAVMYGPPGRAYVYLVYGMHDCLNIVTESGGSPAALLVRAVEPLEGADRMRLAIAHRRSARRRHPAPLAKVQAAKQSRPEAGPQRLLPTSRIASGPGLVCAAFDLDRTLTGADLFDPAAPIRLAPPLADEPPIAIATGPRVGIGYAGEPWTSVAWRFAIDGNPAVSRPRIDGPAEPTPAAASRPA